MANLEKLKRPGTKGAPPRPTDTHRNLQKKAAGQNVPLQLKISPEQRRQIKAYAVERDLTASDLLWTAFEYYRERH